MVLALARHIGKGQTLGTLAQWERLAHSRMVGKPGTQVPAHSRMVGSWVLLAAQGILGKQAHLGKPGTQALAHSRMVGSWVLLAAQDTLGKQARLGKPDTQVLVRSGSDGGDGDAWAQMRSDDDDDRPLGILALSHSDNGYALDNQNTPYHLHTLIPQTACCKYMHLQLVVVHSNCLS